MHVYLIESAGLVKIGRAGNPQRRLRQLAAINASPVELLHQIATDNASWLESYLHALYAALRVRGEWFKLSEDDLARLKGVERMDRPEAFSPLSCNGVSQAPPRKKTRRTARERQLLANLREVRRIANNAVKELAEGRACFAFLAGTVRNIARDTSRSLASCKRAHKPRSTERQL